MSLFLKSCQIQEMAPRFFKILLGGLFCFQTGCYVGSPDVPASPQKAQEEGNPSAENSPNSSGTGGSGQNTPPGSTPAQIAARKQAGQALLRHAFPEVKRKLLASLPQEVKEELTAVLVKLTKNVNQYQYNELSSDQAIKKAQVIQKASEELVKVSEANSRAELDDRLAFQDSTTGLREGMICVMDAWLQKAGETFKSKSQKNDLLIEFLSEFSQETNPILQNKLEACHRSVLNQTIIDQTIIETMLQRIRFFWLHYKKAADLPSEYQYIHWLVQANRALYEILGGFDPKHLKQQKMSIFLDRYPKATELKKAAFLEPIFPLDPQRYAEEMEAEKQFKAVMVDVLGVESGSNDVSLDLVRSYTSKQSLLSYLEKQSQAPSSFLGLSQLERDILGRAYLKSSDFQTGSSSAVKSDASALMDCRQIQ